MSDWLFLPPWGMRLVAAVGAGLVLLLALRALHERRMVTARRQAVALVLRTLVIAALLLVALNPTALRPRETPGKPALVVLIDTSSSMATRDVRGSSRLAAALDVLKDQGAIERLADRFTLDVRTFDREVRAAGPSGLTPGAAQGRASDLGAAISAAVADLADRKSQAGILLVSDGRETAPSAMDAAGLALARSVPLWTWCLGGQVPRRDLWIEPPANEVLAFADSDVELAATFHAVGYENRSFRVELLADDRPVATTDVIPEADGQTPVRFQVQAPKEGEHRYTFRAVEDELEVDRENNQRSVFLRVVGEKARVFLAEGQPHWDTKFLVQCLKHHPRVDLTAVYRLAEKRQFAVLSSAGRQSRQEGDLFPRNAGQFAQYDAIILGRGCEAFFDKDTEDQLTQFVARQGGGLVFCRGKAYGGRFQPLAKLEPVVWGPGTVPDAHLVLTGVGRASPVLELAPGGSVEALLARLPAFGQVAGTRGVKPLAVVLAESQSPTSAEAEPATVLMAYQHYGQGRVVTVNAGGLWRWAFHEKASEQEEVVYERFWIGLLRWLLSGSEFRAGCDVALRSERRVYTDEQLMRVLIQTRGLDQEVYRPRLTIQGPGGATEIEPRRQSDGSYAAEAGPLPSGTYELKLAGNIGTPAESRMTVEVVSASVENRVLSADPELMARLSERSEGQTIGAGEVGRLDDIVDEWRARQELAEQKITLWDKGLFLAAMVGLLGVEWFLRRREGLL